MMAACACMGPMYGEPHCICTMRQLRLPLNAEARAIENARAQKQLDALFGPGGAYHRLRRLPAPPANARILVSRNKREGRYAGWSRDIDMDPVTYAVFGTGSRHQRENLYAGLNALRAGRAA